MYLGKSASYREKVVLFGQKWLNSGKSGCIGAKVVVFVVVARAKVVVFVQSCCIGENMVVIG